MENELNFRIGFAALLLASFLIGSYHSLKTGHATHSMGGGQEPHQDKVVRIIWGWVLMASFWAFIFFPHWLQWSAVAVPDWVRWSGLGVGILGLVLMMWVLQYGMGGVSSTAPFQPGQPWVVSGPYRAVRHPMYSAIFLLWAGLMLLAANWFIAVQLLIGVSGIVRDRAPLDDARMLDRFGDSYREYIARTGRFLPRLRRQRAAVS
jgi:protein-S-isoprenylcysteine O-methyltransferase Ste14